MSKPKLLDLYCCQGGAAVGYERAGWTVYCVDIAPQRHYPFAFHLGSAIDALGVLLAGGKPAFTHRDSTTEYLGLADLGVYGGGRRAKAQYPGHIPTPAEDRYEARYVRHGGYVPRSKAVQQRLLGIDWMTVRGMQESLPPVYTQYIGDQLVKAAAAFTADQGSEVAA